jgi:hypothetical protein
MARNLGKRARTARLPATVLRTECSPETDHLTGLRLVTDPRMGRHPEDHRLMEMARQINN